MKSVLPILLFYVFFDAHAEKSSPQPKTNLAQPGEEKILEKISESEKKLLEQNQKKIKLLGSLYQLNLRLRSNVKKNTKLQGEKAALNDSIQRLEERLKNLDESSMKTKTRLSERLRTLHRMSQFSVGQVFSAARSAAELDRNLKILGLIATRDRDLIREYQGIHREIKTKKEKLAQRLAGLQKVENKLRVQENELEKEVVTKNKILDGLKKKKLFTEQSIAQMKKQAYELTENDEEVLEMILKPSFSKEKGKLPAPLFGEVLHRYGTEKSTAQTWSLFHKGMTFQSVGNKNAIAVFEGRVAWADFIAGRGYTIILDHGDHYYTVYSGLEKLNFNLGQEIKQYESLGTVATLDGRAELYFEIRHFTEPYDPYVWLKGNTL